MEEEITCPSCGELISPKYRHCEQCGVDIAVATHLAEQQVILSFHFQAGQQMAPELLVPRIGDLLLERGIIKPADLESALCFQEQQASEGRSLLLGQALLELGFLTREDLDRVVTVQIIQLQKAIKDANYSLKQRVLERTLELQQALVRISELNQLKSNFIANISHELRTPLTHIKGYLDLLGDEELGPINYDQNEAIRVLKKAEARLESLIEDLIQFSQVSHGEINLSTCLIEITELVKRALNRSEVKAKLQDIHLVGDLPDQRIMAFADEEKIFWVLMQLLDNAIKFSTKGSEVVILTSRSEPNRITISIEDNGIGIPAERLTEIFEPFHQLDGSASRSYSGTGLGLAMVKRILEAHGSQMKVHSIVGQGSRFEFDLPLEEISLERVSMTAE